MNFTSRHELNKLKFAGGILPQPTVCGGCVLGKTGGLSTLIKRILPYQTRSSMWAKALFPFSQENLQLRASVKLNDHLNRTMEQNASPADIQYTEFLRIKKRKVCLKVSCLDSAASAYVPKLDIFKRTYYVKIRNIVTIKENRNESTRKRM